MESLVAFFVAATLIAQFRQKTALTYALFGVAIVLLVLVFRMHATSTLKLEF